MSGDLSPVPRTVIEAVNEYVRKERADNENYDNREPLDDSGVWSLHDLARRIYASGWSDGHDAQRVESEATRS